jgi:hypothetical protein
LGVAGRGAIPADAGAAVLYVAAINASGVGYITVHPCAPAPPNAASLNFVAGVNRGNEIIAPLDDDGGLCIFTSTATQVTVDAVGYLPDGDAYTPLEPARLLETRDGPGLSTVDGASAGIGRTTAGGNIVVDVAGRGDVPADATTATINLTAIGATEAGFVTVHPCLPAPPNVSALNYVAGVNGGNEIVAQLDDDGRICLFTSSSIHLTVDVAGST